MRTLYPALLASLLALSPLSCKRSGGDAKAPSDSTTARPSGPKMPRPLDLPASPAALVHIDAPKAFIEEALAYAPGETKPRTVISESLQASGLKFESQIFPYVGLGRAWNMAHVKGQTIVHVPVKPNVASQLSAILDRLPPEGDFGAVKIPRGQGEAGPKLAFFDKKNNMLTLAGDLRGIATGPELGRTYGKQGVNVVLTKEHAARYGGRLPANRVVAKGKSASDLELTIEGGPPLPAEARITDGALTGLLESGQIALGGSTKYVDHKKDVEAIISQGRRQVSSLPSIAQGNGKELLNRGAAMLRQWNGRSMVGVGPANHVLLGFGADDPEKMSNATLYFMRGIISNIKTVKSLRSFGVNVNVPTVRFAPSAATAAGQQIHMIGVENAKKYVPSEYHRLINDDGRLRIALAFPKRTGAGMVAVGPDAKGVMTRWLENTKSATPAGKSQGHLASGTIAVGPKALQSLSQPDVLPATLLGLSARRAPTKIVVRRQGQDYVVRIRGEARGGGKARVATP